MKFWYPDEVFSGEAVEVGILLICHIECDLYHGGGDKLVCRLSIIFSPLTDLSEVWPACSPRRNGSSRTSSPVFRRFNILTSYEPFSLMRPFYFPAFHIVASHISSRAN